MVLCNSKTNSVLTISGTSNIAAFSLKQSSAHFLKNNLKLTLKKNGNKLYISENELFIPVKKFTTDLPPVLHDFRKMMQADRYPYLTIKLLYVELPVNLSLHSTISLLAFVNIQIVGKANSYAIPVIAQITDKTISINGNKPINIEDFGLKSSTNIFGLIKVSNWVDIQFNINLEYALID